jgi:AcrR family transcriptional regulator
MADETRRRSDALQNREAILTAARDALTESADVSLNAVAKRANVANATLYRNFSTRDALILEVYRQEVDQLVRAADRLFAEQDAESALEMWVIRLAQYAVTKQGLGAALQTATGRSAEMFPDVYAPIVGSLGRLIEAAEAAGVVRQGLSADDVILLLAGLVQLDPHSEWRSQAARLFNLVLVGLQEPSEAPRA